MLKFSIIGAGAAGNKALAGLIESGYPEEYCCFLNSTKKDIPEKYQETALIFGKGLGGCGKERSLGKSMLLEDLQKETINLDTCIPINDSNAIIIVGSCEGGSGSASIPILAKYYNEVYDKPVVVVLFFGFRDDVRGIQNTIEIVQELSEDYTVIGIDNSKFLNLTNMNRFKAEKAANKKFNEIVKLLMGGDILPGEQIIDDTDLFKIISTPGYMVCDAVQLPVRIKTMDEFNDAIYNAINSHPFVDPPKDAGPKRMGLIFNVTAIEDTIDYRAPQLNALYGDPYELFISLGISDQDNEFFYIVSGMRFPIDEVTRIYKEYLERSEKVVKSRDTFFDTISEFRGNNDDAQFDMLSPRQSTPSKVGKKNFFADFGIKDFKSGDKIVNTGVIDKDSESDY